MQGSGSGYTHNHFCRSGSLLRLSLKKEMLLCSIVITNWAKTYFVLRTLLPQARENFFKCDISGYISYFSRFYDADPSKWQSRTRIRILNPGKIYRKTLLSLIIQNVKVLSRCIPRKLVVAELEPLRPPCGSGLNFQWAFLVVAELEPPCRSDSLIFSEHFIIRFSI